MNDWEGRKTRGEVESGGGKADGGEKWTGHKKYILV